MRPIKAVRADFMKLVDMYGSGSAVLRGGIAVHGDLINEYLASELKSKKATYLRKNGNVESFHRLIHFYNFAVDQPKNLRSEELNKQIDAVTPIIEKRLKLK